MPSRLALSGIFFISISAQSRRQCRFPPRSTSSIWSCSKQPPWPWSPSHRPNRRYFRPTWLLLKPALKRSAVVVGQYIGFTALTVAALACSLLALAIPDRYIHYLGVLPILIGLWHLVKIWRYSVAEEATERKATTSAVLGVASVTMANGSDNIAVYIPLFGRQPLSFILLTCAIFAAMTALWCTVGLLLTQHPKLGAPLRNWGQWIMPFVLIGPGAFILAT